MGVEFCKEQANHLKGCGWGDGTVSHKWHDRKGNVTLSAAEAACEDVAPQHKTRVCSSHTAALITSVKTGSVLITSVFMEGRKIKGTCMLQVEVWIRLFGEDSPSKTNVSGSFQPTILWLKNTTCFTDVKENINIINFSYCKRIYFAFKNGHWHNLKAKISVKYTQFREIQFHHRAGGGA